MSSMIEKISRALCIEESQDPDKMFGGGPGWKVYEHLAIAAIKAMREPTQEMVEDGYGWYEGIDATEEDQMPKCVFRSMIDAALKESEE